MQLSSGGFSSLGSGVSDIFSGLGDEEKAKGSELEAQSYTEAATLAGENATFTGMSTAIKEAQTNRELLRSEGATTNSLASAGFKTGTGSGLDILRQSASEGSTTAAAINYQGGITQAGYEEQQSSYTLMASAAQTAASADKEAATGSFIAGGINIVAGLVGFGGGPSAAPMAPTTSNNPTQIGALY